MSLYNQSDASRRVFLHDLSMSVASLRGPENDATYEGQRTLLLGQIEQEIRDQEDACVLRASIQTDTPETHAE